MDGQKHRLRLITCKALVLAHNLSCVLYQPHVMTVMDFNGGGEGIDGLHGGLHCDYKVSHESPFGHVCPVA